MSNRQPQINLCVHADKVSTTLFSSETVKVQILSKRTHTAAFQQYTLAAPAGGWLYVSPCNECTLSFVSKKEKEKEKQVMLIVSLEMRRLGDLLR
jgi:hypothetical protein